MSQVSSGTPLGDGDNVNSENRSPTDDLVAPGSSSASLPVPIDVDSTAAVAAPGTFTLFTREASSVGGDSTPMSVDDNKALVMRDVGAGAGLVVT